MSHRLENSCVKIKTAAGKTGNCRALHSREIVKKISCVTKKVHVAIRKAGRKSDRVYCDDLQKSSYNKCSRSKRSQRLDIKKLTERWLREPQRPKQGRVKNEEKKGKTTQIKKQKSQHEPKIIRSKPDKIKNELNVHRSRRIEQNLPPKLGANQQQRHVNSTKKVSLRAPIEGTGYTGEIPEFCAKNTTVQQVFGCELCRRAFHTLQDFAAHISFDSKVVCLDALALGPQKFKSLMKEKRKVGLSPCQSKKFPILKQGVMMMSKQPPASLTSDSTPTQNVSFTCSILWLCRSCHRRFAAWLDFISHGTPALPNGSIYLSRLHNLQDAKGGSPDGKKKGGGRLVPPLLAPAISQTLDLASSADLEPSCSSLTNLPASLRPQITFTVYPKGSSKGHMVVASVPKNDVYIDTAGSNCGDDGELEYHVVPNYQDIAGLAGSGSQEYTDTTMAAQHGIIMKQERIDLDYGTHVTVKTEQTEPSECLPHNSNLASDAERTGDYYTCALTFDEDGLGVKQEPSDSQTTYCFLEFGEYSLASSELQGYSAEAETYSLCRAEPVSVLGRGQTALQPLSDSFVTANETENEMPWQVFLNDNNDGSDDDSQGDYDGNLG